MGTFEHSPMDGTKAREVSFGEAKEVANLDKPYEAQESAQRPQLTLEQKEEIEEKTQWSSQVVDVIGSMEEFEIYEKAGLKEVQVGDKSCLVRPDIDFDQKDSFGRTNKERMENGLAPLTPQGRPYELHHIGQHQESPLAELTMEEHRGKGNDGVLHIKVKESEIDREAFAMERAGHWKERAEVE